MHLHDGSHAVPDTVQGTAGIVRQLNGILSGWVNGNINSGDAGIACGQIVHKAITDAGLKDELPEDDCRVTLQKLPERMDARVLEIHTSAVECIVLAAPSESAWPVEAGRKHGAHAILLPRSWSKLAVIH